MIAVLREEPADHVHEELHPRLVRLLLPVALDGQGDDPLASLLVAGVLPLRSDALAEHQVVCVGDDLGHRLQVVVHTPKVL